MVRLTPKGGRDAIDGIERLADGSVVLKARVRAAPSEGEANAALMRLIAKAVGVRTARRRARGRRHGPHQAAHHFRAMRPRLIAALEKIVAPR